MRGEPAAPSESPAERIPAEELLYQGHDPREMHKAVARHITPHRLRLSGTSTPRAVLRRHHPGTMALYELAYGTHARLQIDPGAVTYLVYLIHTGGGHHTIDGTKHAFSPTVINPGQDCTTHFRPSTTALVLTIPRALITEAVLSTYGTDPREPSPLPQFAPHLDPGRDEIRRWLSLAHTLRSSSATSLLGKTPAATRHFEQFLVHALLAAQPHTLSDVPKAQRPTIPPGIPHALVVALTYCDERAAEPITIHDMATAAGTSVRTLQDQFRRHLGVTPTEHLRRIRLARAHAELLAAAGGYTQDSVSGIAFRWQFNHLGRFSHHYRAVYGKSPSQTIRMGRRLDE